jgi:hypothetical protein
MPMIPATNAKTGLALGCADADVDDSMLASPARIALLFAANVVDEGLARKA